MRKPELHFFRLLSAILACAGLPVFDSWAQSYPAKPIRIVVGFAAGGATDATGRMVAQKLSAQLSQPVVVENRTGAGGSIATERVATSPADGYTLLLLPASGPIDSVLRPKLPYDLVRDFATISLVVIGPYMLVVHPSVPARDVRELVALARSRPGKLVYGSAGVGSSAHFANELFNSMAKVSMLHVPYKGAAESVIANAAGEVDLNFTSINTALPLLEASKLRPLAVTSAKRSLSMPSLPTLDESGLPGYDRVGWWGVLAPAGVPKDVVAQLNATIAKSINTPDVKESLAKLGFEPKTSTPEQFAALIRSEIAQNAKLVKAAGVKAE